MTDPGKQVERLREGDELQHRRGGLRIRLVRRQDANYPYGWFVVYPNESPRKARGKRKYYRVERFYDDATLDRHFARSRLREVEGE